MLRLFWPLRWEPESDVGTRVMGEVKMDHVVSRCPRPRSWHAT
jgi:hypothetical protein